MIDGEPVAAAVRTSRNGALASNLAQGGSATPCPGRYPQAEALAVAAARAVGLTIAGVDLLFSSADFSTICEVNSAPGWRPEMTAVTPAITVRRPLPPRAGEVRRQI
ncbi:hypothetical protein [Streptomyces inhibens]|uniref:hypothetical protein n=1 Tax=Streptomyces inhibens TaxID=2293571 RepID=UPI001FD3E8BC|nr:hypothetical protein [Streptomyces inhibens]